MKLSSIITGLLLKIVNTITFHVTRATYPKGNDVTIRAKQLYPKIRHIFVGTCAQTLDPLKEKEIAHTHACKKNAFYRCICVKYGSLLFESTDLAPSIVLKHEYAHILADYCSMCANMCEGKTLINDAHGDLWLAKMRDLGVTDVDYLSENIPANLLPASYNGEYTIVTY